MSSEIITKEQKENYGKFSRIPNLNEISKYFTLDNTDLDFISKRRGYSNKLGVALQLTCVRFLGTFPSDLNEIPTIVKNYVAEQLSIGNIEILNSYSKRETTKREHQASIRKHYKYKEYTKGLYSYRLTKILYYRVWYSDERPSLLFDIAVTWLISNKILLPGYSTLTRLIVEIRQRAMESLWEKIASLPSKSQKIRLNNLLKVSDDMQSSMFDYYRKGPVKISTTEFTKAIKRYEGLHLLQ